MYRRLLVPLDGSRLAEAIFAVVERLAAAYGATVVLLHVIERGAPATVHGERHLRAAVEAQTYLEGLAARLSAGAIVVETHAHDGPEGDVARSIVAHAEARGGLDGAADRLRAGGTAVTAEVRRGDTLSALADEATEAGVGLVVVATHGRAGVQAIWAGSVATRLLARTRAPLLLLRRIET